MDLKSVPGFGVAGNFAGHLEQVDFLEVVVKEAHAPKGIFPFYLPGIKDNFLSVFPVSSKLIVKPIHEEKLQIEPEVGLICDVSYESGTIVSIAPTHFTAYNDCSIRKQGAKKISEKKNWGEDSKGVYEMLIPITTFSKGGIMDTYHIVSYLKRENNLHQYGQDSPVLEYGYFYEKLINWIIEKFNTQHDHGPLEDMAFLLKEMNYPEQIFVGIGATRYTDFGEKNFLQVDDKAIVVVYDSEQYALKKVEDILQKEESEMEGISILRQKVVCSS